MQRENFFFYFRINFENKHLFNHCYVYVNENLLWETFIKNFLVGNYIQDASFKLI